MEYRSIADLNEAIFLNGYRLPRDIDLVIGIPRSGLLAASLVALNINVPLLDLESFLSGAKPQAGRTVRPTMKENGKHTPHKVLVVDDSILTGVSMAAVRARMESAKLPVHVVYCAIYGAHNNHPEVDLCLEIVPHPRIFQWNLMRHNRLADACFDLDGVLCHDPTNDENDDGPRYIEFLLNARPLMTPNAAIKHLVTSRLEKYRPQTEQWLERHGIVYDRLWMLDLPSAEERRKQHAHASHKAKVYLQTDTCLFVESDDDQAEAIAGLSGRPVLSIEGQRMVWPSNGSVAARKRYRKKYGKSTYGAVHAWTPRPIAVRLARLILGNRAVDRIKSVIASRSSLSFAAILSVLPGGIDVSATATAALWLF